MIKTQQIKVTTTGSAGSATGAGITDSAVTGKILALYINYHASTPATADLTITERKGSTDIQTIWTETNSTTDVVRYPNTPAQDNAENAVTYDGTNEIYIPFVTDSKIRASLAQADALTDAVVVEVRYDDGR